MHFTKLDDSPIFRKQMQCLEESAESLRERSLKFYKGCRKYARAGIQKIHFLPFNPTDKRTALTYLDSEGKMHRVSKGAPEQILNLTHNKSDIERRVHSVIDKFAERCLHSLAVAYQEVPEGRKESAGGPWQFIGLMPLFDPPRHDSAETIRRALNLGVNVKMITDSVEVSMFHGEVLLTVPFKTV
ncbi:hypothetical protein LOK49_LG11G01388 [Camellia lanceoleosa]|uniref:Uncharacterized protein n=1 Tax=Camellia lanceoleosa TaxID=1840588 RepID=A0ACC0G1G9_9ERIC|nr:hypothetical protein LOK49_LG11G01388 [Camellia lanceoleosa]